MKILKFKLVGITPTMQSNGQLADPLHPIARAISKVSQKRKKSEEDHVLLSKLEWLGRLYLTEPVKFSLSGNDIVVEEAGKLCYPTLNIERMIVVSATIQRLGAHFERFVWLDKPAILDLHTRKTVAEMFEDPRYYDRRMVKLGKGKNKSAVMRTRPIFNDWSTTLEVCYDDDNVEKEQIVDTVERAGAIIGLSDYRPKYGKFMVESVEDA